MCWKCELGYIKNGEPSECLICKLKCVFETGNLCRHCESYLTRFGEPIICNGCHKKCAFKKPQEEKDKLGGKNLCYLCTRQFKLDEHRRVYIYTYTPFSFFFTLSPLFPYTKHQKRQQESNGYEMPAKKRRMNMTVVYIYIYIYMCVYICSNK